MVSERVSTEGYYAVRLHIEARVLSQHGVSSVGQVVLVDDDKNIRGLLAVGEPTPGREQAMDNAIRKFADRFHDALRLG